MTEGGCLCGRVRYRLEENPHHVCDCHCIDCRRASGAPFVTWGIVAAEKLTVRSGEVRTVKHANRVRSFAACCGTSLFFQDDEAAPSIDVAIAKLDDPEPHAPDRSIWVEDHISWVPLDPDRKTLQTNKEE